MDRRLKIVARVAAGLRTAQRASQPREWFLCALGIGASVDRLTTASLTTCWVGETLFSSYYWSNHC
jgi:hypothetical protein